jgi:hypothetical protein
MNHDASALRVTQRKQKTPMKRKVRTFPERITSNPEILDIRFVVNNENLLAFQRLF